MKKLAAAVLLLVAAVAAGALFWLRSNLDGLVKDAIEKYGSEMTRARVTVAAVEIGAADGRGVIRGLSIGNPAGFRTPHALEVAEIEVAVDLASLAGDVVTISRIAIAAPDVIYEKGDAGTNFDAIQKNIAAYIGPSKQDGGKKLIVTEFTLRRARAQASAAFMQGKTVAVALPDITLRDLGKSKGGMTPGELGQTIAAAIKQRLSSSVSFDRLAKSASSGLESAGKAIKGLFGN
jgi:uncharacterized protein involved in outer membrane biogenesis